MSVIKNFFDAVKFTALALFFLLLVVTFTIGVFPLIVFNPTSILTIFSWVFGAITIIRLE